MSDDPFRRHCIAPVDPLGFIAMDFVHCEDLDDQVPWDEWVADQVNNIEAKLDEGLYFSWEETWVGKERIALEFGCLYLIKNRVARRVQPGDLEQPAPRVVTWPPK